MNIDLIQILVFVMAYLVAGVPFGLLISKLVAGSDIRKQGSGNIGATNVARTVGKKWGLFVLFLDGLKGYFVVAVATHFGSEIYVNAVCLVAVIAHCYPVYLKFKGGKGVATSLGVLLALSPMVVVVALAVFVVIIFATRIVSAASLGAALAVPITSVLIASNLLPLTAVGIAAIVWWKHRENIKRLMARQEPKFF